MSRLIHSLFILALNAVPLVGVLLFGWSPGTLLVVIWVEVLFVAIANVVRISLHRKWTQARGHYRLHFNERSATSLDKKQKHAEKSGTLLSEYATLAFVFTLAHGLILGIILFMLARNFHGEEQSPWGLDVVALRRGVLAVAALTAIELLLDVPSIRARPFSWLRERVQVSMAQVVIVHLAIIFGTFLLMYLETPLVYLGIIIGLKALLELGMATQNKELPAKPPGWLSALARRQGLDMEAESTRIIAQEKQRLIDDEQPMRA